MMKRVVLLVVIAAGVALAQTKVNPKANIEWPRVTGAGAPAAVCDADSYGMPYTDITSNAQYVCSAAGWVELGAGSAPDWASPSADIGTTTPRNINALSYKISGSFLNTGHLSDWTNGGAVNGNCPVWNSSTGKWTPGSCGGGTGGVSDMSKYSAVGPVSVLASRVGLLAEYTFDEPAGSQRIINRAFPSYNQLNVLQGDSVSDYAVTPNYTTANYGADSPFGPEPSSDRVNLAAGSTLYTSFPGDTMPAGTYTCSLWAKATSGSSQKFRILIFDDGGVTWSADQTATANWQQFSFPHANGSTTAVSCGLSTDAADEAADFLLFGLRMFPGVVVPAFQPHYFDGVLGAALGTASDPVRNAYGLNAGAGLKYAKMWLTYPETLKQATVYAVARTTTDPQIAGYLPLVSNTFTVDPPTFLLAGNAAGTGPRFTFGAADSGVTQAKATTIDGAWHTFAGAYGADGVARVWVDGVQVSSGTAAAGISYTLQKLFAPGGWGGVTNWPGDLAYVSVYRIGHTHAQVLANLDAIKQEVSRKGITLGGVRAVLCEGDSITDPNTAMSGGYCNIAGLSGLSPWAVIRNTAIQGSGTADIAARLAINEGTVFASWHTRDVLTILDGANSLSGSDAVTWYAGITSLIAARKAANPQLKVGLATILPRTATGFNTARAAANALVRANTAGADFIIDFAADATCGADGAASDTSKFYDGTHPTSTCQNIFAPIWKAAVQAIL